MKYLLETVLLSFAGALCIFLGVFSLFQLKAIDQSLTDSKETAQKEHPAIHSTLEVFAIPLRDSIYDICYDPEVVDVAFQNSNVVISSQCPLDSSRRHTNFINHYKKIEK